MEPTPPLVRVAEELISLRERCDRQHQRFEQQIAYLREHFTDRWSRFAADAQAAYQQLRDELIGHERLETALLHALIDRVLDLERLAASGLDVGTAVRSGLASLAQFGVERFVPEPGERYDPRRHERVGGDGAVTILNGVEPGFIADGRILLRAKVILG